MSGPNVRVIGAERRVGTDVAGGGAGLAASLGVALPCKVFSIVGFNNNAAAQYIQVFDAAALPADGVVPRWQVKAFGDAPFSFDIGDGAQFDNGIYVCNSSTSAAKTIGAADCLFDIEYRKTP